MYEAHVDPFIGILNQPLKVLDCGREIQNNVHIDAYYCKPELIAWR